MTDKEFLLGLESRALRETLCMMLAHNAPVEQIQPVRNRLVEIIRELEDDKCA